MNVWAATLYSLAGGLLLAKVYSRWSHAYPWNWDQAWSTGMNPPERKAAAIVWLVLLGTIAVSVLPRFGRAGGPRTETAGNSPGDTVGQSASDSGQPTTVDEKAADQPRAASAPPVA
jgi:hypothetical protein